MEERRAMWTSFNNLQSWFQNWGEDLVELGFAHKDGEGNVIIPDEQLRRILSIDETCLSLDGSNNVRGGRPVAVFFDPCLPQASEGTSKSLMASTLLSICLKSLFRLLLLIQFNRLVIVPENTLSMIWSKIFSWLNY